MLSLRYQEIDCCKLNYLASECSKASPTSSSLECSPCDHGKETSPNYECKNPIKGSMYFPHDSLV